MYQRIILSKYSVEDFSPLVEHIVGVSFSHPASDRDGEVSSPLVGWSEKRLFFMYDARNILPPALKKIIEGVPDIEVRSVFFAVYSESVFSDESSIERDSEYDSNQIMLNFVDDEGALALVSLDDVPRQGMRQIKVRYETLAASTNYKTGVRLVKPVIREVEVDFSKLLPL
ncbi:hypothetical protein JJJ17_09585 [Paracoccus caeni]|uniref:Uncharacterized protein n=1 Tax=Paracoccus caeni TaxID=657651 RepID=A0A934SF12_9RHOB|nr:hypothetical protein [Paracoccus caeni]MBK4216175.1 hypothetical protein [Paracoccus caeni]